MAKEKLKINSVYLTGNLAQDAKVTEKATFITVATYNGKDREGNKFPANFIDVSLFNVKKVEDLTKGKRITIVGKLSTYKDKETGYTKMGVTGLSYRLIENTQKVEVEDHKEAINEDIWEEVLGTDEDKGNK